MADVLTDENQTAATPMPWESGYADYASKLQALPLDSANSKAQATPQSSSTGALVKSAAAGVLPSAGAWVGALRGARIGALAGQAIGLGPEDPLSDVLSVVLGIGGAGVGSLTAAYAQHKALQGLAPTAEESIAKGEQDHPVASTIGSIASALPFFEFNPGQTIRGVGALYRMAAGKAVNSVDKDAAKALAAQTGLAAGTSAAMSLVQGQAPTLKDAGENIIQALLLGKPRFEGISPHAAKVANADRQNLGLPPVLDEQVKASENVTSQIGQQYQIQPPTAPEQEQIRNVALREMSGENTPNLVSDLAYIQADPAKNAFYTLTKRNIQTDSQSAAANVVGHLVKKAVDNGMLTEESTTDVSRQQNAEPVSETRPEVGEEEPRQPDIEPAGTRPSTEQTPGQVPHQEPVAPEIPKDINAYRVAVQHFPGTDVPGNVQVGWPEGSHQESDRTIPPPNAAQLKSLGVENVPDFSKLPTGRYSWEQAQSLLKSVSQPEVKPPVVTPQVEELDDPLELIPKMAFDEASVKRTAQPGAGAGTKSSQAFEETDNPDVIYDDARASKGNKLMSRKLAVMQRGNRVMTGTAYQNVSGGKTVRYIAGKRYDDLVKEGWKPIASVKTIKPTKGYTATYSLDRWVNASQHMRVAQGAAQSTAAAMEEKFSAGSKIHQQVTAVPEEAAVPEKPAEFGADHAEAIWEAVRDADPEDLRDTRGLAKVLLDGGHDAVDAFKTAVRNLGDNTHFSPEEIVRFLTNEIYEHVENEKGAAGIEKSVRDAIDAGRNEVARHPGEHANAEKTASEHGSKVSGSGVRPDTQTAIATDNAASIAKARGQVNTNPTEAQRESGDYAKGHATVDGLPIAIENPKGSIRRGVGPDGKEWSVVMPADYGYVKGSEGFDGDEADVYLGPNPDGFKKVWVVDQINPDTKKFDEHKALVGFNSKEEALATYNRGFSDGKGLSRIGAITEMSREDFHDWVNEGDFSKPLSYGKKPISERARALSVSRNMIDSSPEVYRKFNVLRQNLTAIGVDVGTQREVGRSLLGELAGKYQRLRDDQGKLMRLITIYSTDAARPTMENFASLIHEAIHDAFQSSRPEVQEQLHLAAQSVLGDISRLETEEKLTEGITQKLVKAGFDPEKANRMIARVMRFATDIYHRVVMAVAKMLGYPPSEERAMEFFHNRIQMALHGQRPMSAIAWLGGPLKPEIPWDEAQSADRFRTLENTSDPLAAISGDVNSSALAEPKLAAENGFDDTLRSLYAEWNRNGLNSAGMSYEDFVRSGNFVELPTEIAGKTHYQPGEIPQDVVAKTNAALQMAQQQPVRPDIHNSHIVNEANKLKAAALELRKTEAVEGSMSVRRREAETRLKSNGNKLNNNNARLQKVMKDYTDLDTMLREAKVDMRDQIAEAERAVLSVKGSGTKMGMLEQVLRQLNDDIRGAGLPKPYETALNKLAKRLAGTDEDFKFADTLQHLANLNLGWGDETASALKQQIKFAFDGTHDPLIAPLLENTHEGRALLATVISYAKSNEHHMDLLQLRQSNAAGERAAASSILQQAMAAHTGAIADARQLAKKLPTLAVKVDRLLTKLQELKDRNHQLIDEIQRDRTFVDFHNATYPIIRNAAARLENQLGATRFEFEVAPGEVMHVPPTKDAPSNLIKEWGIPLDLRANGIPDSTMKEAMRRMQEWMDNHQPDKEGAAYQQIAMELDKLRNHAIQWGLLVPIKGSLVNRWMASDAEKARYLGLPLGRLAATLMEDENREWRTNQTDTHRLGTLWESRRRQAMTAMGVRRVDTFQNMVHDAAMGFLEKRQDLAVRLGRDQAQDVAIKEAMDYLRRDPDTQKLLQRQGATEAVERFLRQSADNDDFVSKMGLKQGNKVKDTTGQTVFRNPIGQSLFVMPRALRKTMDDFFATHMAKLWGGDRMKPDEMADAYRKDPAQLKQDLESRFTRPVWDKFVRDIVYKDGRSGFYAPIEQDGIARFTGRMKTIAAYEATTDPISFAERLYQLEGGNTDLASYVGETLDTFQNYYELLHGMKSDIEEALENKIGGPKRWLMDARKSEESPKEWLEYLPFDKTAMSQIVRTQIRQGAYGRNYDGMRKIFTAAGDELNSLNNKFLSLRSRFPELTGAELEKAMRKLAETDPDYKGTPWTAMREAARNKVTLAQIKDGFDARIGSDSSRPPEANEWYQLLHSLTSAVVSGPSTLITAHEVFMEQPFRAFGLTMDGLKFLLGTTKGAAKTAFASLLQAVHVHVNWDATHMNVLNNQGVYPDGAVLKFMDKVRGTIFHNLSESPLKAMAQLPSRVSQLALGLGAGRAVPGKPIYPQVQANLFSWAANVIHVADSIQWIKTFESLAGNALAHFRLNPNDFDNRDFKFKPKDLGLGAEQWSRALPYLQARLAAYGQGSIEDLVRDAMRRRDPSQGGNPNAPLLTAKQYRIMTMQSLDESTLESSPTTRPGFLVNRALGQAINPMLGWSIDKTWNAYKGFREPDGQRSWRGFTTGMAAYAAILPIGLGVAMLRNKFDEDVLGKKQNIADLGNVNLDDPKQAFGMLLENTARIGTWGIAGEIPNYWFNQDANRPVSIDSRVFLVSTLLNVQRSVMGLMHSRNFDYDTVVRPFVQAFGGNGVLQDADILNHTFALDNAEARSNARISVNNYLRVAGRMNNMDVRSLNGTMSTYSEATPVKPWVGKMVMAAYANDPQGFADARRGAIQAAKRMGKENPESSVLQAYEDSNPLRIVFRTLPSQAEYQKMLSQMDGQGQAAVATSLRNFKHYGDQIGMTANLFGKGANAAEPKQRQTDDVLASMLRRNNLTVTSEMYDNEVRRRSMAY